MPVDGEVVLTTSRLRDLGPIDPITGQVTVGAGVTVAALQRLVRPAGFDFGVDFAARDSATIGGLVSTNAGGERVLRYGSMRQQVIGLEAVLADGSVLTRLEWHCPKTTPATTWSGCSAVRRAPSPSSRPCACGLWPLFNRRSVALLALDSTVAALEALAALRPRLTTLEAAELFLADGLALVREHTGLPAPVDGEHAAYLLVECADRADPGAELMAALEATSELVPGIDDIVIGEDAPTRERLWRYREAHTESINAAGVPVKLDVAVPRAALAAAIAELPDVVRQVAPEARTIVFGHLGEGNLHVNVLGADDPRRPRR